MSRAQRTGGREKRPRARVPVFLFSWPTLFTSLLSLCTSLVVPAAATDTSSGSCLSLPPTFATISAVHTLARLGIWDLGIFFPSCSLSLTRDLAQ